MTKADDDWNEAEAEDAWYRPFNPSAYREVERMIDLLWNTRTPGTLGAELTEDHWFDLAYAFVEMRDIDPRIPLLHCELEELRSMLSAMGRVPMSEALFCRWAATSVPRRY